MLHPTTLPDRFACIVGALCRAVAAAACRNPAAIPVLLLAGVRCGRMVARFTILAARAGAGTLPRCPAAPRQRPPRPPRERQRLPQRRNWLIRLVPEATCFGSQLQTVLAEPEMKTLLQAAPQAGRILRPLCRLLAVPPGPAALPPSPATPPRTRRKAPRQKTPRPSAQAWPRPPGRLSPRLSPAVGIPPSGWRRRLS